MSDGIVVITFISGEREFPIPDHVDIFHLRKEIDACDKTALEAVMDVDAERIFLEKKAEELSALGFYPAFNRVRYFRGRVSYFDQLEARKHRFLASDWSKYDTLEPRKYRSLFACF